MAGAFAIIDGNLWQIRPSLSIKNGYAISLFPNAFVLEIKRGCRYLLYPVSVFYTLAHSLYFTIQRRDQWQALLKKEFL